MSFQPFLESEGRATLVRDNAWEVSKRKLSLKKSENPSHLRQLCLVLHVVFWSSKHKELLPRSERLVLIQARHPARELARESTYYSLFRPGTIGKNSYLATFGVPLS